MVYPYKPSTQVGGGRKTRSSRSALACSTVSSRPVWVSQNPVSKPKQNQVGTDKTPNQTKMKMYENVSLYDLILFWRVQVCKIFGKMSGTLYHAPDFFFLNVLNWVWWHIPVIPALSIESKAGGSMWATRCYLIKIKSSRCWIIQKSVTFSFLF